MSESKIPRLDPIIHSPVRLAIMSILISVKEAEFNYIKQQTGTTDGNLSTHLTKLEDKGFIRINKFFKGKKPVTSCQLTEKGKEAFTQYINALEYFVQIHKDELK